MARENKRFQFAVESTRTDRLIDIIPEIDKCCFCVSNLKYACIVICIILLTPIFGDHLTLEIINSCTNTGVVQLLTKILLFIVLSLEIVLAVASIVFLIGIFTKKKCTATFFLFTLILTTILREVFFIIFELTRAHSGKCKHSYYYWPLNIFEIIISHVILLLIVYHFVTVVKTYRKQMGMNTSQRNVT